MWIVFRAMDPLFGSATDRVAAGAHGNVKDPGLQRQYLWRSDTSRGNCWPAVRRH